MQAWHGQDNAAIHRSLAHAVAHIKEEGRQVWWRCDDDSVTVLEDGPASHWGDLGNAPPKKDGAEPAAPKASRPPAPL